MHRVVITGMGLSTSLGPCLSTCWQALVEGRCGIAPISFYDPSQYDIKVAAECPYVPAEVDADRAPREWCRRYVRLFYSVAQEAYRDAGLEEDPLPSSEIGIAGGGSVNWIDVVQLRREYFDFRTEDGKALDLKRYPVKGQSQRGYYRRMGEMMLAVPARLLRLGGPQFMMDTACAASAHAIGEAYRLVKRGKVRAMLAGGSAALVNPIGILAFALLGALSKSGNPEEASRPFDRLRDGFVMGEGAGAIVLESLESAKARGARIYAELVGYGSTLNAYSLSDPSPDGNSEARAMRLALEEAGMTPEQVDYVAAHGTSTPKNDAVETTAIKLCFGKHSPKLLVSSIKGHIGHTISAAGVCNLISAVKSMGEGQVPPTLNLRNPDPGCDLDYVPNHSRRATVRAALVNAFAFGGQNAVLAVKAWDT